MERKQRIGIEAIEPESLEGETTEQAEPIQKEVQTGQEETYPLLISTTTEKPIRRRGKTLPQGHVHHWIIDEPEGSTSTGHCGCGSEKQFKNWLSDSDFITNEEHRVGAGTFDSSF